MDLIAFVPLLIGAFLSIIGYKYLSPQLTKIQRWSVICLIIVSLIFSGMYLQQQEIKDKESSPVGVISSNLRI